ncbi:MAG: hypothetical protein DRJ60_04005 [Thermoprotei archaeon]|nr:MAG: hypothetical protein DRJ60_04005 [Thermoprotei archaeon]
MPVVEIVSIRPIRIKKKDGAIIVYRICYRYGDILTACVWIDEDKFSPENIRKMIKADLETRLKEVGGKIEV